MRLLVLAPHFAPDTAPTGMVVTALVDEWCRLGHQAHVVTSLPWYTEHRVVDGWDGWLFRRSNHGEATVTRLHPFPVDKSHTARRALAFGGFSALAGAAVAVSRGPFDAVFVLSPPLTLALAGRIAAIRSRCPLILNVQDVFPDVAIAVGALTSPRLIALARRLERFVYRSSDAVTVLSADLKANISAKLSGLSRSPVVETIPNFVDSESVRPMNRLTNYRRENELGDRIVVMYAGNLGHSQSLDLIVGAAKHHHQRDDIVYVINGGGVRAKELAHAARSLKNLVFVDYQPMDRLPEVLATGDIHLVLLRSGLGASSVPSKAYGILAAGRPIIASIDPDSAIVGMVTECGAGLAIPPDSLDALVSAVERLAENREARAQMGVRGRRWAEAHCSPEAAAVSYLELFQRLSRP